MGARQIFLKQSMFLENNTKNLNSEFRAVSINKNCGCDDAGNFQNVTKYLNLMANTLELKIK